MFHPLVRRLLPPAFVFVAAVGLASRTRAQTSLTERYRETALRIVGAALVDDEGWKKLEYLTTRIGNRLSGSTGLERAIEWAVGTMHTEGLEVHTQPAMVPHWVRGHESVEIVSPVARTLGMLGLGMSVGTPADGITAPAVVVRDFDELEALGRKNVEGKIVVYAVEWAGYGRTVQYRGNGASRAAALGAVAVLVRSATGASLYTPHTGALFYAADQPRIPAAAITPEDAAWFLRMREAGEVVTVRLRMEAHLLPDAPSANVVAEIRGRELPDQVVVMGGHFDSWDVGQGAHDDGASCMAAWEALTILHRLGLQPRRTLRVVLWTNEENGTAGGKAYRAALGDDVSSHVAALEMDGGCERPTGFGFSLAGAKEDGQDERYERGYRMLTEIGALFETLDASAVTRHGHGTDIEPLTSDGVPGLSLDTVGEHYFDWHHTNGDTLDKVDPHDFRKAVALLGVMGYVLADMPETLAGQAKAPTAVRDDAAAEKLGWKLGVQAWTFRDRTCFEAIDTAARLGLAYIELYPGQSLSPAAPGSKVGPDMGADELALLKQKLRDDHVTALSFGVVELNKDEAAARKVFEFARALGLANLSAEPEPDALDLVARLADEFQIDVAFHNHPQPSRYWNPDVVLAATKGRTKRLGSCSDTGHWTRSGLTPVECLKKLEGRVIELHFKDLDAFGKPEAVDVPWGSGKSGARAILGELARQGFHGLIDVEYETGSGAELEQNVARCIEFFDRTAREFVAAH